jgi:hypothetical protein
MPEQSQITNAAALIEDDKRVSGEPWRDAAMTRHTFDQPSFCPGCAYPVGDDLDSLAVEYWEADRPVYRIRCASCGWTGEISPEPG